MADNYDELLRELDKMAHYAVPGLEQSDTSRLASAAIRALQAENERLRESDARWSVFAEECGKTRTILEDQRDEARRELATMRRDETRNERDDLRLRLAEALFREGKACLARDAAEEELEAVREECQHEREAKVAAQFQAQALEKAREFILAYRIVLEENGMNQTAAHLRDFLAALAQAEGKHGTPS